MEVFKEIKYIAFYEDTVTDKQNRYAVLAAVNKINYINSKIVENGYTVNIISPSWTLNNSGFYRGGNRALFPNINLRTFHTFSSDIKALRMFKYLFSLIQLFLYLIKNTYKGEPVIVYHSVILSLPVRLAKAIRKFTLILEVEEIYQDVASYSNYGKKSEYKVIHKADKYIFSTEMLHEKLNIRKKPFIVIYGAYYNKKIRSAKEIDGYIHVVYAGTFQPKKGGDIAIRCAAYLPENYHVHIIGFGSAKETKAIKDMINIVSKSSLAGITFEGTLYGEDYISFLQTCHIGLSPQDPSEAFCDTSFPSKILSYMSNGLRVVSGRVKAVEKSKLGDCIYFYNQQTPGAIADRIKSVNLSDSCHIGARIELLDKEFSHNLIRLIQK